MTMIGIPIMFVLLSTFELARGIWTYHTLTYAVKEGTRYTIVRGQDCNNAIAVANNCQVTVAQIATQIQNAAIGLDPTLLQVEMISLADDTGMHPLLGGSGPLLSNSNNFPTGTGAAPAAPITFLAKYPFHSAIVMFWPGANGGFQFGSFSMPASSQERIQF